MPGTGYLDMASARKQLNQINVQYPTIEFLLRNNAMVDQIVAQEVASLGKLREDLFVRCGNMLFKPTTPLETKTAAFFRYNPNQTDRICNGGLPSIFHFHGIYLGYPSNQDRTEYKALFASGIQDCGIAGLDGIHISTFLNHDLKIPWSKEFYDKLAQTYTVIDHVTGASSIKLKHSKMQEVTLQLGNGGGKQNVMVTQWVYEEPSRDQRAYPYRWIDAKHGDAVNHVDFLDRHYTCVIISPRSGHERLMTCVQRDH
jgi:hypothetical protein